MNILVLRDSETDCILSLIVVDDSVNVGEVQAFIDRNTKDGWSSLYKKLSEKFNAKTLDFFVEAGSNVEYGCDTVWW